MQFGRGKPAVGAFFDSDFTTIDSVLAQALLHGLQGKNDCRVATVTMSRPNLAVAGFTDMVERYYRGPAGNFAQVPPMGMITTGQPGETSPAFTKPFELSKLDGTPAFTNRVKRVLDTGDPNTLIRNYLQAQADQNAFYILAGPATNLAAALEFRGMKELIAAKIKYLVAAIDVKGDPAAAKKVLADWPTPIYTVPPEVGAAILFPGASIDKEFATTAPDSPLIPAYKAWKPMPYDTPGTAMAAVLFAARPKEGYFKVSDPDANKRQYLIADPEKKDKVVQTWVELASAKPVMPVRFRPAAVDDKKDAEDKKQPDEKKEP